MTKNKKGGHILGLGRVKNTVTHYSSANNLREKIETHLQTKQNTKFVFIVVICKHS